MLTFGSNLNHAWKVRVGVLAFLLLFGRGQLARAESLKDWKSDWQLRNSGGVYAVREGEYIRLGNDYLERVFRVSDDVLRTVQLVNKVSGEDPGSQDEPEFTLEVSGSLTGELDTPDFKLVRVGVDNTTTEGTLRAAFALECRKNSALVVTEMVETYAHRRYQRKWLEVNWTGDGDVVVNRIDVEDILFGWWYVANPSHMGYGQPVFVEDLYLGLEYPGADTGQEGYTYLRHYPGRSAKGGLQSKTAIWGVAKNAFETEAAFYHDYLYTLNPQSPTPFVLYNLLGLGSPDETKVTKWVDTIAPQAQKSGLQIDSYVIDDGWQDMTTVWQPDQKLFPGGFTSLVSDVRRYGSHLGLWMSLGGITLDTRWGNLRGLEVAEIGERGNGGRYCLAGPKYFAALKEALRHYVVDDRVNYFKFDYNVFGCDVPTHGHPVGRAGKDAQIDAYIELLRYVKSLSPRVHIAITSGMWLSPWWTLYEDWVWLGGSDMGSEVPSLTSHDSEMTYRDSVLYDDFRVKKYVFPFSSVMTHGFWVSSGTLFPQFEDDCMMTIGRGITDWEILTSPQDMDTERYEFLSRAIRWGKANWDILSDTKMILGDPGKGEVYGYVHSGNGATLLFLRNPSLQSKIVSLPFDSLGIKNRGEGDTSLTMFETYPAYSPLDWNRESKSGLQVPVLGAQTKVLVIVWDKNLMERLKF